MFIMVYLYNIWNKPAAQAADTEPSQCNSTCRQIHQFRKIAVTFEPMQPFKI